MKIRHKQKRINTVTICTALVMFCILSLTIAFSSFQASLNISNIGAVIRRQQNIRITGLSSRNSISSASSSSEEYNINNFTSQLNLPNSDSKITYDVTITNIGNVEMGVLELSGLPSNLKYTLSGYNLGDVLCDDNDNTKCILGSVTTIHITIEYANNAYDSSNTTFPIEMDFNFGSINYVAQIGNTNYETLQKAVNAVPTNNTETTIRLLKNTAERISVKEGRNVVLDFQGHILSNYNASPIIEIENVSTVK